MAEKPETRFKRKVVRILEDMGAKVFVIQQLGKHGDPDLLICLRGKFIALELKKDIKSKARPLQVYVLEQVTKARGFAKVVYPENLDETIMELNRL